MLDFQQEGTKFVITYKELKLFTHSIKKPLITIGKAQGICKQKHGLFKIHEKKVRKISLPNFELVEKSQKNLRLKLSSQDNKTTIGIIFIIKNDLLNVSFEISDPYFNRLWFNLPADENEAIYGCGEQFSYTNLQGLKVPLWVQEQGVGRGDPLWYTFLANILKNAGGNHFTSYHVQPTFISSRNYFCHAEMTNYAEFNFKSKKNHQLYFWAIPDNIVFGRQENPLAVVSQLSELLGRQPELPEWCFNGLIVGIQGGTKIVENKISLLKKYHVPTTAIWCQDWEGRRITSFGKQLFWDWQFDDKLYPDLPTFIDKLHAMGLKFLGYINPFLALEGELYKEASKKELLVKKPNGDEYHIVITTFPAALLDLTNPETVRWVKKVIKDKMIGIGLDGWMCDFGEYLPTDAVLHSGESAESYHNRYPVDWAKINYEVLVETGNLGKLLFFTRAGYSHTSKYSPLIWAGDQACGWSIHDGLASVIPAGISLGLCSIGYYHFDIGGYTTLGPFKRTKELFMRWTEAAAFSMVMRTHEGNRPDENWQFDSDVETLEHLAKMTEIHVKLTPYLKHLSAEYQDKGYPPMRACYLHYPKNPDIHAIKYQYLLGKDLLIAPIITKKAEKKKVFLPNDKWIHLWTGKEFSGGWIIIDAPLGEPPVFYRKTSDFSDLFASLY